VSALLMGQVFKYATALEGTKLLMLLALADCADDDQHLCWPSAKTLAQRVRISDRQAQRVIAELVAEGYVEIAERGGGSRSNQYRVLEPSPPTTSIPTSPMTGVTELCRSPYDTQMSYEPSYNHQEVLVGDEDLEGTERMLLSILSATPDYKFDWGKDLAFIRSLALEFPTVDRVKEFRQAQLWVLDNPKVKNFRLFFRNWVKKACDDDLPKPPPRQDYDPWEGIPESTPIPDWVREP
jgi:hypothetical protein